MKANQSSMWILPEMNETHFKIIFYITEANIYATQLHDLGVVNYIGLHV